jgi:UDP-glucose 4-epimerase
MHLPSRAPAPPVVLFAEAHQAKQILGWKARHGIDTIVRTAFEWEERLPSYLKQG